jgi:hypothetical protein
MSPTDRDVSPPIAALAVIAVASALAGCGAKQSDGGHGAGARPTATASPTPGRSAGAPSGPPRTHDAVVRAVAGRRIRAGGRSVRIDPGTVACGGIGDPVAHVGAAAAWQRFRCIQPTFPAGSVAGPDLVFTVASVAPRRFVIERARLTSY